MPIDPLPPSGPPPRRRLSSDELAAAIHARDASAFFVEPRVLRRVIKLDRDIHTLGLQVPHASCYVIEGSRLIAIVDPDELRPTAPLTGQPPERVILLALPEADDAVLRTPDLLVAHYVRLLFHARVHLALEQRAAAGRLEGAALRERICRLGPTAFEEARAVLRLDDLLLPPSDDLQVYIELAATFLELERFAPELLPEYFPAIGDPQALAALFAEDVADDEILAALRRRDPPPLGPSDAAPWGHPVAPSATPPAALPPIDLVSPSTPTGDGEAAIVLRSKTAELTCDPPASTSANVDLAAAVPGTPRQRRLLRQAQRSEEVGNLVLAAILRVRAGEAAPGSLKAELQHAIDDDSLYDLRLLAARLQTALGFDESERAAWERCLRLLLRRCADDRLTVEGRLLYDLQKVCVDHEREIFTIDLSEWILSWGRHPIRRPLPALKEVLTCKHLRIALRRSHDVALAESDRSCLAELLHAALHHAEDTARERLRPGIAESLRAVGLVPANVPEEVGRHKMVEELLDKAVESGYLRFGDLRDAISRNNLKLPDLASLDTFGPLARQASGRVSKGGWSWLLFPLIYAWLWVKHLLFGDHLLRADRELAGRLDGVYHRAEIYLRVFQRITSYGFGIGLGRLLNRFLILPLLGAFLVVSFYQELAHLTKLDHVIPSGNVRPAADEPQTAPLIEALGLVFSEGWDAATAAYPASLAWLGVLALFFLGLINSAAVRRVAARLCKRVAGAIATGVRSLVRWLARPLIQVLYNPWIVLARRYVLKPAMFTLLVWLVLLVVFEQQMTLAAVAGVFIGLNFLINSRVGRNVEEITNEWLAKTWVNVRARVAFGLYWLIVDLSNAFLEAVDRLLYAVDEWLRFRRGESQLSFAVKAALGGLWTAVTYVVRFTINLLIEPQINPIKHFPVVTVSHKVVWSLAIVITPMVADATGWDEAYTLGLLSTIAWAIPGIFGFLAWELKENWKLYAANRPPTLRPVRIGHHGETMGRLLLPGFHSGTVPKLFRKIRRAHRKARRRHEAVADLLRKPLKQLAHLRHALSNYVEREFFHLLKQCPAWRRDVRVGEIDLATNRIRLELCSGDSADDACWLSFEQQGGWLLADVEPGWAAKLPDDQRAMFRDALVGLYKTSGVELLRPHLAGLWPGAGYRVCPDDRLVLWPSDPQAPEVSYPLEDGGLIEPVSTVEVLPAFAPLAAGDLLFSSAAVPWPVWVEAWDRHAQGASGPPLLRSVRVIPAGPSR